MLILLIIIIIIIIMITMIIKLMIVIGIVSFSCHTLAETAFNPSSYTTSILKVYNGALRDVVQCHAACYVCKYGSPILGHARA